MTDYTSSDISFDLQLTAELSPDNRAPDVQVISELSTPPNTWMLVDGSWSDDALPLQPVLIGILWSQLSGPGDASFENEFTLPTLVSFPFMGDYVLEVAVSDGDKITKQQVSVRVRDENASLGYEDWIASFFSAAEQGNASVSGEDADPDMDGHSNRDEFEAGTDPRQAGSVTRISAVSLDDALNLQLEGTTAPGRAYILQATDNLSEGRWDLLESKLALDDSLVFQLPNVPDTAQLFFRIMVVKPLN